MNEFILWQVDSYSFGTKEEQFPAIPLEIGQNEPTNFEIVIIQTLSSWI